MEKYNEILRLKSMLEKEKIPFTFRKFQGGYQIIYNGYCSIIEHSFSYGNNEDLLEINALLTVQERQADEVVGYLTAEDVFNRIKLDWDK